MWIIEAQETVQCRVKGKGRWDPVKGCEIGAVIDNPNVTINSPQDETIEILRLDRNYGLVEYLPINIHIAFPNLIDLTASECSIKMVHKENFRNLSKLKLLVLGKNKLKIIDDDTFVYLEVLEYLYLR